MIQLTNEILQQARSSNGGWSAKQVELLGRQFKNLRKGWQTVLIGQPFPKATIEKFIALKDVHLKQKTYPVPETEPLDDEFLFATKGI